MVQDEWTIKRALDWTRGFLADKGCENPKASSEWLIGSAAGLTRLDVYMNLDRPLSSDELSLLHDHVKRRAMGEPLQYISGKAPFRHITVNMREGVLIPRPETEVLVSELLALLPVPKRLRAADSDISEYGEPLSGQGSEPIPDAGLADGDSHADAVSEDDGTEPADPDTVSRNRIKVADLCTGSGCIACSLAYEHPDIDVIATDISPDAVLSARENRDALGLAGRISVLECDLGSGIETEQLGSFDAVISNPPYIPSGIVDSLPSEVSDFEPRIALDGGEDGLDIFRRIAEWSLVALRPGAVLAVELHEDHLDDARCIAEALGFKGIRIASDLAGKPRVLIAYSPDEQDSASV